jgi:hypothetical protein
VDANRSQGVLRVDYNITENTRAYVRLARDSESPRASAASGGSPARFRCPTPVKQDSLAKTAVFNLTSVFSPTATNEIIFSYSKLTLDNGWEDPSKVLQADQGTRDREPLRQLQVHSRSRVGYGAEASMWAAQDVDNIFATTGSPA